MIRRIFVTPLTVLMMATAARPLDAQTPGTREVGSVPRDVSREAVRVFNATGTKRVRGDILLGSADTVRGDLAVLNGHARVGGVITGQLVVLNGDVTLISGGRIDGGLTVIGGSFESPDRPAIGGEIRVWSARLRYREEADSLVADVDRELFTRWARWQRDDPNGSKSQLFLTTAHTYNRVEGLPIYLGPRLSVRNGDTRVEAELFGIFRTSDQLDWIRDNLGHRVRLELKQGRRSGFVAGARLFDEVDAVERWQLSESEVGMASFFATRDYRDYWQRHGALGYFGIFGPGKSEIRASYGQERWSSRRMRDVPSLFNSDVPWRVNPRSDDGVMHLATISGTLDTRNRVDDPRSGWFLQGEYERGTGALGRIAPATADTRFQSTGDITYARALVDLRRYNRLAPGAQINLRVVAGGWLSGDPLPMQRRFSVSGIDALPGFDFRQLVGTADVGTCATGDANVYAALGRPAQCERMMLLQAEWKGDFRINLFGNDEGFGDRRWMTGRFRADGAWVVFANSGRGWLMEDTPSAVHVPNGEIPSIGTWHTDIGGGFDFGSFGVYVAKAVSEGSLPANVYVRLGHRF
ncbi:MAG: hypothetical protein IPP90_00775 [Gemmatimonadaceae bacterium]|nr:hypothetical protein [Gemmatimonadaceae bacterium]